MTIRYKCDECGSVLNIKDEKAGTTGRCPKCKAEFLVPAPDAAGPHDDDELADEAPEAPAEKPAVVEALAGKTRSADENLSDDEIEKLLEGDGPKAKAPAALPHDDYGVADGVDEPYDDDDDAALYESPSGSDSQFGVPARGAPQAAAEGERSGSSAPAKTPRKKPRRTREPEEAAPPAFSAAGIAEGLMARGDNLVKHDLVERKAGRPFGGVDKGTTDDEGRFGAGEIIGYFARYAIPVLLGLTLSGGFYYWWYSGWIRGKLPALVPVTGTVMLDGEPLPRAEVHFHPMQADPKHPTYQQASSLGFTDANGNFSLIYLNNAPGAVVGRHRVQVFASDDQGREKIPPQYNSRSSLTAEVKADSKEPLRIELSTKVKDTSGGKGGFTPPSR
jgi:DNA-directed RNA polymerase subunit RPC12/RpoP